MKLTIKNISKALLVVLIALAVLIPVLMLSSNTSTELNVVAEQSDVQLQGNYAIATADEAAQPETQDNTTGFKAIAAAVVVGIAAAAGAIGMAYAIAKAVHGIARQPEADNKIRTTLMLGLVFIETAIIYALIVAILIIFVM